MPIPLEVNGQEIGELRLTPGRGAQQFTVREMAALQRCADTIACALMLAERQEFLANLMS
ncbi:MAG: hypothetical protein HYY01_05825 [Chloroflexi bacterium]|nr:hypothetical protein [Chloroflexota bacterium]